MAATAQINAPANDGLMARGQLMASQGNFVGALDQIRLVDREALGSDERMALDLCRAQWLYRAGEYADGAQAFAAYADTYPFSASRDLALKGKGDCLFATANYDGALRAYNEAEGDGMPDEDAAELYYRTGICALELGKTAQAKAAFKMAAAYRSTRSAANFYLGKMAYDAADYQAARESFRLVNTSEAPGNMADFYLASIDFAEGNYSKALSGARQALKAQGLDAAAIAELNRIAGESLYRLGQRSEACSYLTKYVEATDEPLPSALYILGLNDFEQGNYSSALSYFRPVTERGEGVLRQSAYLFAGQCLLEEGDTSAAILAFDKAAKTDDDPAVREAAFYNYAAAKAAGASVPFASAAETFEEFLKLYPSGPYSDRVASYLASGYMADNDYERALSRLRAINSPSPRMQAAMQRVLYTLGMKALRDADYPAAHSYLAEAEGLKRCDDAVAAEVTLAQGRLAQAQGNPAQAAEKFRTYLRTAPRDAANRPVGLYGLAYALYNGNDASGAASYFEQAAKALTDPAAKADCYNRLGDLRFAHSDFEDAARWYATAYGTNPEAGDYAALSGARMKGYMRDYEGKLSALDAFRRDFASSALMPDALLETTQAQISLGRNADAVATYRTLIADYPQTTQGRRGYLQMAMTLLDMGRTDEAAQAYRSVIELYPTSAEAAQASALLKNLYAGAGRADEYLAFISSVKNAPQIDPGEAEELAYTSACKALESRSDTRQLESFVESHPSSQYAAPALGKLLQHARSSNDSATAASLAKHILDRYPDSREAESALLFQAASAYSAGELPQALEQYKTLAEKASDASTATAARLGVMRTARDMGDYALAGSAADAIIASSASPAALSEARFTKAKALDAEEKTDEAIAIWLDMASSPAELFGAKSAFEAADALHEAGREKEALEVAQKFVQSGSPHRYWVARGFILLSDIYTAQGKTFEAREYLEALRDNYPGEEADIFMMIDSRLSDKQ